MSFMSQSNTEQSVTRAQDEALAFLASVYGEPRYVNRFRPQVAIWADFEPCEAYPCGSCWRIEPDGAIDDMTEALLMDPEG
jgi:hypothetical protein